MNGPRRVLKRWRFGLEFGLSKSQHECAHRQAVNVKKIKVNCMNCRSGPKRLNLVRVEHER
jgi:hypothetical protein